MRGVISVAPLVIVAALGVLSGCNGGGGGADDPAPGAFDAVDAEARATYESLGLSGMGLAVYDGNGDKVFESMYGTFSGDQRVYIASASKMVSGVTLFRLVDQGALSLDSTTGEVLGWSGDNAGITLRHLLSFRSGLEDENACTYVVITTLASCVEQIEQAGMLGEPGSRFDYGSTHLHVAGRMAEVATGKSWNTIFTEQLVTPLGLPADIHYFNRPDNLMETANPLLAGGLVMSMNEYAQVLHFIYDKGVWHDEQLIDADLFTQQAMDPYPGAVVGQTPAESPAVRYGLAAWLECSTPTTGCAVISSPGLYGFTPWLDREHGYYAILGMENRDLSQRGTATDLEQRLKPLIVEALQRL
jgi:CubicO group peptidase (beta-lactamase class C family)